MAQKGGQADESRREKDRISRTVDLTSDVRLGHDGPSNMGEGHFGYDRFALTEIP